VKIPRQRQCGEQLFCGFPEKIVVALAVLGSFSEHGTTVCGVVNKLADWASKQKQTSSDYEETAQKIRSVHFD
jgi:hypothetical protein